MEPSEDFQDLKSPMKRFFSVGERELARELVCRTGPRVACESHGQLSLPQWPELTCWALRYAGGPWPHRPGSSGSEELLLLCSQPLLTLTNTSWIFSLTVEGTISRSNLNSPDPKCFSVAAQEITTLITSHADRDYIFRLAGWGTWRPQPKHLVRLHTGCGFGIRRISWLICHLEF